MDLLTRMSLHLLLILFVAIAVPLSMVVALVAMARDFMVDVRSARWGYGHGAHRVHGTQ